MKRVFSAGAAAALLLSSSVAHAHHSFAMFDLGKDVTVEAVIKEVQFTNPHVWLQILVADDKGGAPAQERQSGWQPRQGKGPDGRTLGPGATN